MNWQVIPNDKIGERVFSLLLHAKREIYIVTAKASNFYVPEKLLRDPKSNKFVRVSMILENVLQRGIRIGFILSGYPIPTFLAQLAREYKGAFFCFYCYKNHQKFVLDPESERLVVTSANWTGAGMGFKSSGSKNRELAIYYERENGIISHCKDEFFAIASGQLCKGCAKLNKKSRKSVSKVLCHGIKRTRRK